jgi:hypothetical protein
MPRSAFCWALLQRIAAMDGSDKPANDRADKMAREAVEEARMVLPGIQTLFGFQLIAVFNQRFTALSPGQQRLHFLAILLIAVAIALIMTPAAYHRQVDPETVTPFFVRLASRLVALAMMPLMVALCLDVHLLGVLVLGDAALSLAISLLLLGVFAGLWFGLPYVLARRTWRP